MTTHSILSPSAASRWVPCPASVALERAYPEEGERAAADEGTKAHAVGQALLTGSPMLPDVEQEMLDFVMVYVDDVNRVIDMVPGHAVKAAEYQMRIPSVHAECFGTDDYTIYDHDHSVLYIWDFKYGFGAVDVFENWQMLCYAAGVLDELNSVDAPEVMIHLRIVQPRCYRREGPVQEWVISSRRLGEYVRRLNAAAHEALGPSPSANPGRHCRYCKARHGCKALQLAALGVLDAAGDSLPLDLPPEALAFEIAVLRRGKELMEYRLAGLEATAMSQLQKGATIPGWRVDHTVGREEWARPAQEVIALGALMGVPLAKPPEPITPKQARDAGIPATLVQQYSQRKAGKAVLEQVDTKQSRRAFGG